MNIVGIIEDSLRYPLSDWKKIMILGIIVFCTSIPGIAIITAFFGTTDINITRFIDIFYLLVYGYLFRVIRSTLTGEDKLPEFDNWVDMFKEGIKVFIVGIVYSIPAVLIILAFAAVPFASNLGIIGSDISTVITTILGMAGIWAFIPILYMIIIFPVLLIAVVNMVQNNGELGTAFRFNEIVDMIMAVGLKHCAIWYIVTGIIYLAIFLMGTFIFSIFSILIHPIFGQFFSELIIGQILTLLIVVPYLKIYLARSISLFYIFK